MRAARVTVLALVAGTLLAVVLTLSPRPAAACACGLAIDATVSEESGLVIEEPGSERIVLSLDLTSDGTERAAVVLPVPATPTVAAVRGGDPLAYLDLAAAPPAAGSSADDTTAAGGSSVEVIGREHVGGYDAARLGAADGAALDQWLADNGYTLPSGAEPILDDYVDEGWRFVAIRLARKADGPTRPLDVSFPVAADEYVYPMRLEQLATAPFDLTLYTLADGPRTVNGLDTVWSGATTELEPPPPAKLRSVFGDGGYVTRLETTAADPNTFTTDLLVHPAVAPTPEDAAATAGEEDGGGISTVALIAIIVAGLAFAAGLVLLTRPRED